MHDGRQVGTGKLDAHTRMMGSAALVLAIAGMLTAGYWAHEAWHRNGLQTWQLAAAAFLAVLSLAPIFLVARAQAHRLRRSEARFAQFLERTSNAIVLLDPDAGRIVDANTCAGELFGCSRDELLHKSLQELFAEEPQTLNAFLQRVRAEGSAWNERIRCVSGGGGVHAEATATVAPEDGQLVLAILRNMDEHQS
ncbi:MAG: PAS domain S-box protein, partial [Gammaproteobacteria bacterium]|nr:PAS domain S-box protein [Gammaproteobacteria bacterium]